MNELPPLLRMLATDLRRLGLDIEYRGHGDQLHLTGNTKLADENVLAALRSARKRVLEVLQPLFADGDGSPVRLSQAGEGGPEPVYRNVPAMCGRGVPAH